MNALFPVYFTLGVVLLGVSDLTLVLHTWRRRTRSAALLVILVGIAWLGVVAAATLIEPQIAAARATAGTPEGETLFRQAHGLSMIANAVAMVSVLVVWLLIAHEHYVPLGAASRSEALTASGPPAHS